MTPLRPLGLTVVIKWSSPWNAFYSTRCHRKRRDTYALHRVWGDILSEGKPSEALTLYVPGGSISALSSRSAIELPIGLSCLNSCSFHLYSVSAIERQTLIFKDKNKLQKSKLCAAHVHEFLRLRCDEQGS
jgi:hypothetical protein